MEAATSTAILPISHLDRLRVAFQDPNLLKACVYVCPRIFQSADYAAAQGQVVQFFRDQSQLPRPRQDDSYLMQRGSRREPLFGTIIYEGRDRMGRFIIMATKSGPLLLFKIYEVDIFECGPCQNWSR